MKDDVDRRSSILMTAGELFAAKGFQTTTVREIGDAVGVLSGSLYHYFDSKEAMVLEIISNFVDELFERSNEVAESTREPVGCLRALFTATFDVLATHENACVIYQNEIRHLSKVPRFSRQADQMNEVQEIWIRVVRDGVESGQLRREVDPLLFGYFARDSICNSVNWFREAGGGEFALVADACTEVLLNGCLNAAMPRRVL